MLAIWFCFGRYVTVKLMTWPRLEYYGGLSLTV